MHQVQYENLAHYFDEAKKNIVVARNAIPSLTPPEQFARKQLSFVSNDIQVTQIPTNSLENPSQQLPKRDLQTDAIRLAQS